MRYGAHADHVVDVREVADPRAVVETEEGHFERLDPTSASWAAIVERLP